jgi:hypothetical protein
MTIGLVLMLLSGEALAQAANDRKPSIEVVGIGSVSTPPDVANLVYWVTGEGKSPDEATGALAKKHQAIVSGLAGLLGSDVQMSTGEVLLIEARSSACEGNRPRLSEGPCAITGHIARLQGNVRTHAVGKAGTAAGLAARLGASDARVQGFQLSNPAEAQRRASAAAIANARDRAEVMAAGAGVRLGELISLNDQNFGGEIVARGHERLPLVEPRQALVAPIEIGVSPRAIETQARVFARFAIAR